MSHAGGRVLSRRELNRALLARQLLLDRAAPPLPRVLERMGTLQAQYAPSMYVGLWSRVAGFERDALTRALERRSVVQATLMRVTIHLVSRADFWPLALATAPARRAAWLRSRRGEVTEDDMARAADTLRARLAGGPLHRREIEALVGKVAAPGVGQWVDLVRVPPSGTWERRRADLFGLASDWIGPPPAGATAESGLDLLVRRYLAGYGPASRADVASFAGMRVADVAGAIDRVASRSFRTEDGTALVDVARAPLPPADTPAPVRFLPTWDATLLVHARRTGLLPEEHRPRIFHVRNPHSESTFLVDGEVTGTWRWTGERVDLQPFGRLDAADRRALEDEAERLAALHA